MPGPPLTPAAPHLGLTSVEAAERLRRVGPNLLPAPQRPSMLARFAGQLFHFFAVMLWIAAVLALVAGLPQLAIAIVIVIVANGVFSFVQQHRAERLLEELHTLVPRRVTVVRDGQSLTLDAAELVVDDRVLLTSGDRIAADARVVEAHGLLIDVSTFTGESAAITAGESDVIFAGTFVTEGEGAAIVTATGVQTRLANIARMSVAHERPAPPLVVELNRVVRTIAAVAVGVGVTFFAIMAARGAAPSEGLLLAVGVTVALVPEALLPTVTLSLAIGARRMAARHALVRRLEAVETLGSTTFICTDKTGTLTMNEMSVVSVWMPAATASVIGAGYEPVGTVEVQPPSARSDLTALARACARTSSGRVIEVNGTWTAQGDPMEAALDAFARRVGLSPEADRLASPDRKRFPFDPRRRRMSVVVGDELLVKGAPDGLLGVCVPVEGAWEALDQMASLGLRVLGLATRLLGDDEPTEVDNADAQLTLLGLVGLADPPRVGARESVAACRSAGIRIAMVTGDHPATAAAVAREVGLHVPGAPIVLGADLPDDEAALGEIVDHDGIVLARVTPEDKVRIARSLRARRHVVAMTGDGVNDGPALREADIGVAMGRSGTDVAREAADLVLLDDDFRTIVAAVEDGRNVYANARRLLTYHIADNVAEVTPFLIWGLTAGHFPLVLGVMQILALDIGTDTFSAVALGAEPPHPHAKNRTPARGNLFDRLVARRAFLVLGPVEALMALCAAMVTFVVAGWRPGEPFPEAVVPSAAGAAFATVVIAQTACAWACRSSSVTPRALGWASNRLLVAGASVELAIAAACLFVPPVALALRHSPPPPAAWAVALMSAVPVLAADWLDKRWRARGSAGESS